MTEIVVAAPTRLADVPEPKRRLIVVEAPAGTLNAASSDSSWLWGVGGILGAGVALYLGAPVVVPLAILKAAGALGKGEAVAPDITHVTTEQLAGLSFPPGHPHVGTVYGLNPIKPKTYIPAADLHRVALREKAAELFRLLVALRVSAAHVEVKQGEVAEGHAALSTMIPKNVPVKLKASVKERSSSGVSLAYDLKISGSGPPSLPTDLNWLEHEPEWMAVVNARLNGALDEFRIHLRYTNTIALNAELAARFEQHGLSLGGRYEEVEDETWVVTGKFASKGIFGW